MARTLSAFARLEEPSSEISTAERLAELRVVTIRLPNEWPRAGALLPPSARP